MSESEEKQECQGCGKMAHCMVCPTCKKLGIAGSHFCDQACFKASWPSHKVVHKLVRDAAKMRSAVPARGSLRLAGDFTGYKFTGPLRPATVTEQQTTPPSIVKPDYALDGIPKSEQALKASNRIDVLTPEQTDRMREAGRIGREVLDAAGAIIKPGVTGDDIDKVVYDACIERGAYPSPLNYYAFPKSVCVSVNEVICHGIPDTRPLEDGDIVNLDVTVYIGGYHADLNETFYVGEVDEDTQKLVRTAYDCLAAAVAMVRPGVMYRELGAVITKVARAAGFSVVRSYCGHGVNSLFHGPPNVPHYAKNKAIGVMQAGHTFTIEPMINAGSQHDQTWPDNWTAVTKDGKRSAQFEHTLLVTETGVEILTARPGASRTEMVWDEAAVQRPAASLVDSKAETGAAAAAGAGSGVATE